MTAVLVAAIVAALWTWHRRRTCAAGCPAGLWPWVLAEVELRAAGAHPDVDRSAVALAVLLDGPASTRDTVRAAVRTHGAAAPATALLADACDRLADADADRLRALAGGGPRTAASGEGAAWARAVAADAVAHRATAARLARVGHAGRWLLLTPLATVATGAVGGAHGWAVAVLAVLSWVVAGVWIGAADGALPRAAPDPHQPVVPGAG